MVETYSGTWWTPLAPSEAVAGTLSLRSGDGPRLEILGSRSTTSEQSLQQLIHPRSPGKGGSVIVHGQEQSGKFFTLYDGFVHSTSFGMGALSTASLYFNRGFEGACIDDPATLEVDSVYTRYPGMDAWLGVRTFNVAYDEHVRRVTVSHAIPKEDAFRIDDHRELVISWTRRGPKRSIVHTKVEIEVLPWFGIRYATPVPQGQASNDSYILGQMLSLLFGRPTAWRRIDMYSPDHTFDLNGTSHNEKLRALGRPFKIPQSFKNWLPHDVLIPFDIVRDQFSLLLRRWFEMHHTCWGAIVPYMSGQVSPAPLADRRFFDCAASAESVYAHFCPDDTNFSSDEAKEIWKRIRDSIPTNRRDFYSNALCRVNALTYRQRLERLFARFPDLTKDVLGNGDDQRAFFNLVKDLRNVEAHRLRRTKESNVGGHKLVRIAAKLKTIIDAWLLAEMGIEPGVIERRMRETPEYWHYASSDSWPWKIDNDDD